MVLSQVEQKLNHQVINYHPTIISPETSLIDIVKKMLRGDQYLVVANNLIPLGIITYHNLIRIIASEANIYSLQAKDCCQSFPYQTEIKRANIYTIAQDIERQKYPAYGCLNSQENLIGIITPKSITNYLAEDSFYQQIKVKNLLKDNILTVKKNECLIDLIKIINQSEDKLGFIFNDNSLTKVVTYQHLISAIIDPNWKNRTIKNLELNQYLPCVPAIEKISVVNKILQNYSTVLIRSHQFNSCSVSPEIGDSYYLHHHESNQVFNRQLSLMTSEQLISVLTPQWQHHYLQQQQQELAQLKTAIKLEKKQVAQEKLLSQLSYRIRQSLNLKTILDSTVNEVRQFLECDRVIVYQLYPDGDGIIIAESVEKGALSILGRVIKDHYFASDFIKLYLNGRVQATDNVFTANISPCHLDLLLSIQVQANLVVPIIFHEQLWGLLAAQNCHNPRNWQEEELDLLQKLASQVAIAIQQSEYAERALQVADYQSAIASLGNTALLSNDLDNLMQTAVEIIADTLKVEYCSFLELQPNQAAFVIKAGIGWQDEWLGVAKISSSPRWMSGYTLKVSQPVISEDLLVETRFSPPPFLHNTGMVCGATVKVGNFGVIGIYSSTIRKFSPAEINFLQTAANVLGTAIERTKSQKQLDCFFHLSLDMFCITNVDGLLQRVNSSFLTTLGYTEEEMTNQNMLSFVHPEDEDITSQELEKLGHGFPA